MGKQFGPWHVKHDGELYHVVTNGGRNADCIVSTRRKDHAALIAAAPDLLQALEAIMADYDAWQKGDIENPMAIVNEEKAIAAIKQAKGE